MSKLSATIIGIWHICLVSAIWHTFFFVGKPISWLHYVDYRLCPRWGAYPSPSAQTLPRYHVFQHCYTYILFNLYLVFLYGSPYNIVPFIYHYQILRNFLINTPLVVLSLYHKNLNTKYISLEWYIFSHS
jgi:hypothetical protein